MQSEQPTPSTTPDDSAPGISGDALQRRRLLLKGLGKGSAVVAAVVPIQSLAEGALQDTPVRLCTVSGVQSNVGSGRTGGTTANCQGYAPSHFATLANWPGYSAGPPVQVSYSVNGTNRSDATPFNQLFTSSSNGSTMFQVFTQVNQTASDKIWAAALLSAVKKQLLGLGPTAITSPGYFPYTPAEVQTLFTGSAASKAAAESFFQGYLQGVA